MVEVTRAVSAPSDPPPTCPTAANSISEMPLPRASQDLGKVKKMALPGDSGEEQPVLAERVWNRAGGDVVYWEQSAKIYVSSSACGQVNAMQRSKKGQVSILIAPGFEEADVSAMTRTLRRSGLPVAVVGLAAGPIRGNYGLVLKPDVILSETEPEFLSAVVLPGGIQGARRLNAEPRVHALLCQVISQGGYVMALEAAYTVLQCFPRRSIGAARCCLARRHSS
jgi:hypothetical protein